MTINPVENQKTPESIAPENKLNRILIKKNLGLWVYYYDSVKCR